MQASMEAKNEKENGKSMVSFTLHRPFTFLAQNLIVQHLPFATRQKLVSVSGSSHLRMSDMAVPYELDLLEIGTKTLYFHPTLVFEFHQMNNEEMMTKKNVLEGKASTFALGVSRETAIETILKSFVGRKGTKVKFLDVNDSELLPLVAHLTPTRSINFKGTKCSSEDNWESVKILCLQNTPPAVYHLPYVANAKKWTIVYWIDWKVILESTVPDIRYGGEIGLSRVRQLAEKWKSDRRSVGTSFHCQFYGRKFEEIARWPGAEWRTVRGRRGEVHEAVVMRMESVWDRVIAIDKNDVYNGFTCTCTLHMEVVPVSSLIEH